MPCVRLNLSLRSLRLCAKFFFRVKGAKDAKKTHHCSNSLGSVRGHLHESILFHLLIQSHPADSQGAGGPRPGIAVLNESPLNSIALNLFSAVNERVPGGGASV